MQAIKITAAALLALSLSPTAFAQQGGMQGHGMGNMDMDTMMKQCVQMRHQMNSGAPMSPNMQTMMRQCDDMDRQMGGMPPSAAPQSTAPRVRTR